jgi:hypothetical protein
MGEGFLTFWFFIPFEVKIQNGELIHFYQKFYILFSSILQNDGLKSKNFLGEIGK